MEQFTEKQLIQFGNYLLSDQRKETIKGTSKKLLKARLSVVSDADIENFKEKLKGEK